MRAGVYRDRGGEGDVVEDAFVDVDVVAIVNVDRGDGPAVQVAGAVHDRVNDYVDVDGGEVAEDVLADCATAPPLVILNEGKDLPSEFRAIPGGSSASGVRMT